MKPSKDSSAHFLPKKTFLSCDRKSLLPKPRRITPDYQLIYPKFSNLLLNAISPGKLKSIVSYSSLLTSQSQVLPSEIIEKKRITTYITHSKICNQLNNVISLNKLEFLEDNSTPRKNKIFAKPKNYFKYNSNRPQSRKLGEDLKISSFKVFSA